MSDFDYRNGELYAEDVPISAIVEKVGTPVYIYAATAIERRYSNLAEALTDLPHLICYSVKANSNLAVLKTLSDLGAGADVVSQGELQRALAVGMPAERIVFSGVGKTADEMSASLAAGIHQFNVESEPELAVLNQVAMDRGARAPISLRVNPDVDPKTHKNIATGKRDTKFGIPWKRAQTVYRQAAEMPGLEIVGVDVHIGSQITLGTPFSAAFARVRELVTALRQDGIPIRRLDLGGGLGIRYDNEKILTPQDYANIVRQEVGALDCELIFEPGRYIVGNAGVFATRIIYVKDGETRRFAVLDGAMNDLIRPALYSGYHRIDTLHQHAASERSPIDLVGPICEPTDAFATNREMPPLAQGDILVIRDVGAYGAVMSSAYNSRPLVPEVMVRGAEFDVVRQRQSVEAMIAQDSLPSWLCPPNELAAD